jgi:pyocin large subunit-like protein
VRRDDLRIWLMATPASAAARLTLIALEAHSNGDGCAWPSVDRLATMTGGSRRTVQRALRELERLGELEAVERHSNQPAVYRITGRGVTVARQRGVTVTQRQNDAAPESPAGASQVRTVGRHSGARRLYNEGLQEGAASPLLEPAAPSTALPVEQVHQQRLEIVTAARAAARWGDS